MIGSVHGCVSCPVVVKPWEPQSLSHPQHPLPSPQQPPQHPSPFPQPHLYHTTQRSSAVHPWPQSSGATDDTGQGDNVSPQTRTGWSRRRSRRSSSHMEEKENLPDIDPDSPRRRGSTNLSPKKKRSSSSSPEKIKSVFRSQQEFAESYERLLEPADISEFVLSSQTIPASSNQLPNLSRDLNWGGGGKGPYFVNMPQNAGKPFEQKFAAQPHEVDTDRRKESLSSVAESIREFAREEQYSSAMRQDVAKVPRQSTPTEVNLSENVSASSGGYFPGRMSLSPPLPSIQSKGKKSGKKKDHVRRLPGAIPPLKPLRPSKGLPSLSSPKFQAVGTRMVPPPPSLSLMRGRKHSYERSKKSSVENVRLIPQKGDISPTSGGGKKQTTPQTTPRTQVSNYVTGAAPLVPPQPFPQQGGDSKLEVEESHAAVSQYHRPGQIVCKPQDSSDSAHPKLDPHLLLRRFSGGGVASLSEVVTSPKHQPVISPKHYVRDAPTPQSLGSSNWSLRQAALAVAPGVDALTSAAAAGDVAKVKAMLDEGVNVNAVNTFGRTAIQVMAHDNTELAELLLRSGADPNTQDVGRRAATSTLRTIAHDVAASGYTDMLRCLLRHGADVNLQDRWGNTPLHLASKGGHLEAVRLLRRGASLDQPNLLGKTPSMLLEDTGSAAAKQWIQIKKMTVRRLQTLCVLSIRQYLGPQGLWRWKLQSTEHVNKGLQQQVLLQTKSGNGHLYPVASSSTTHLTTRRGSRSQVRARNGNGNGGHPLLPGMTYSKQMNDFLSLRDLIPRRLSTGENTSLEVHNTSSGGQSTDDISILGVPASSSLASETGSLFETNLSSIDASHSADDVSLPSFDQSL